MKTIHNTEFYRVADESYYCCDEFMFRYYCLTCEEFMGCYFCEFDYTEKHDCEVDE
jgi:hypothetical protein